MNTRRFCLPSEFSLPRSRRFWPLVIAWPRTHRFRSSSSAVRGNISTRARCRRRLAEWRIGRQRITTPSSPARPGRPGPGLFGYGDNITYGTTDQLRSEPECQAHHHLLLEEVPIAGGRRVHSERHSPRGSVQVIRTRDHPGRCGGGLYQRRRAIPERCHRHAR